MHYLFEFLAIALVLAAVLSSARCRSWLSEQPARLRLTLAGLTLFMIAGHFARSPAATFPFVFWEMYTETSPLENLHHIEVEGITSEGETVLINPSHLYPSLGFGTLRIHNKIHRLATELSPENKVDLANAEALLLALARTYEKLNPAVELREVSMLWIKLPFEKPAEETKTVLRVVVPH